MTEQEVSDRFYEFIGKLSRDADWDTIHSVVIEIAETYKMFQRIEREKNEQAIINSANTI